MPIAVSGPPKFPKIDDVVYKAVNDAVKGDKNTKIPLENLFKTLSQYKKHEIEESVFSLVIAHKLMFGVSSKIVGSESKTVQLFEETVAATTLNKKGGHHG